MTPGPLPYRGKRLCDLVILGLVAVPAGLIAAIVAVLVKLSSPGPVLFVQCRTGVARQEFRCLKFRTMIDGDNPLVPDATRITGVGRWLRRLSIDELPQLVNVARGEMSIVGPRPMLPVQADACDERQQDRFSVRPGLTGWAQVNGRNSLAWSARIDLDLEYVRRQSLGFDLRILARTVGALVSGSGVEGHDAEDPFVTAVAERRATSDA